MTTAPALVVFDLAGTTVADRGEVAESFRAAFAAEGLPLEPAELARLRGASKRRAVRELLPADPGREARAERLYERFRSELAERFVRRGVTALADAESIFARLRREAVAVALNTGFDRQVTRLLLDALGWDFGVVDAVVCGDDVPRGRPAPDLIHAAMETAGVTRVERVAAVGDTVRDLEAGRRAGVRWNVGVLSGAHDRSTLAAAPHTHLLPSIGDLPALFGF